MYSYFSQLRFTYLRFTKLQIFYTFNFCKESLKNDTELRKDLVEELADVLMFYNDILLCYGISADELTDSYIRKFERNMSRW